MTQLRALGPGFAAVAPMHFPSLIAASDLPAEVSAIVDDLLARKAVTSELGSADEFFRRWVTG